MSNEQIKIYDKVAKMPKNTKASTAYNQLQNIKINKNKIWYFVIENEIVCKDGSNQQLVQVIKYNTDNRVDLKKYVSGLKKLYKDDNIVFEYIKKLKVEGNKTVSLITNIEDVEINGKKLISIIVEDLIKLLYCTTEKDFNGEDTKNEI